MSMKSKTGMHRMPDGTMMKGEKHGYNYGGMSSKKPDMMGAGMSKGGMTKKRGYAHGGLACGASNPAERPMKKSK
jgi:hypothetical protein